jgi:hypothetical protein
MIDCCPWCALVKQNGRTDDRVQFVFALTKRRDCVPIGRQYNTRVLNARTAWFVIVAAQRVAVQLPQAHRKNCQKANDLARAAVGCNGGLGVGLVNASSLPNKALC